MSQNISHSSVTTHPSTTRRRQVHVTGFAAAMLLTSTLGGYAQEIDATRTSMTVPKAAPSNAQQAPLAVTGCAANQERMPITYYDNHHSLLYRLTDHGMRLTNNRRMDIVGGLRPTTNIAAQLGSIDNTLVANAAMVPSLNPIGRTPFMAPKERHLWVPLSTEPCTKP